MLKMLQNFLNVCKHTDLTNIAKVVSLQCCNFHIVIELLQQNLEIVSLCKILQFSLLNFD